jgi:hypothetical protein
VELLHDYYADGKLSAVTLAPSQDTEQQMRNLGIVWRLLGNKLVLLVRTNALGMPAVDLHTNSLLEFYLKPANAHFYNITNLGFAPSGAKRYYWSNEVANVQGGVSYLSKPIVGYDAGTEYSVGSMAGGGGGEVLEAIRASGPGDAHGIGDSDWWMSRGTIQPVHNGDLVNVTSNEQAQSLGIIAIRNVLEAADTAGVFTAPANNLMYTIHFASRAVLWVFKAATTDITGVDDDDAGPTKMVFAPVGSKQFISEKPGVLRETGKSTLSLASTRFTKIQPVAPPGVSLLNTCTQNGNDYYCAETTLIY